MTRFEESALRGSVCESGAPISATLPYWHPSSQFSSLIDPHHNEGMEHSDGHNSQAMQYTPFPDDQLMTPSQDGRGDFNLTEIQRHMAFSNLGNFAHGVVQEPADTGYSAPTMPQLGSALAIRTPARPRAMRRPGLAGASALVNGQFCCQWSVNGAACRHKFIDAKQLNDHIRSHHVRGAANFVCYWSGCDKGSFPTANKLVRHVHSHTGYKPFPCPDCSHAFVTKDQLDKHLTTHTGAKDFVCTWPGCGRSFAVKHALDGHMNSVHLKAKKHVCPHCAQAFDDSSNLSKHKKQVHNPEIGIKCPARHTHGCTYVDSRKDKMKEHCDRKQHGLETTSDPHAWNLWVQQFKTSCKKAHCRRHSVLSSPMSRVSSMSTSSFDTVPRRTPSIECSKQGCNVQVCLPCNILCTEAHSDDLHQLCDEPDCEPCDPCNDPDCDIESLQACDIAPCSIPHCQSASSSPSRPSTPHGSYFQYHTMPGNEGELFHDAAHPFSRLSDYIL